MTLHTTFSPAHPLSPQIGSRRLPGLRLTVTLCATLWLAGCAIGNPPRSVASLPKVEYEAEKQLREAIVAESRKISSANDALQSSVNTKKPSVDLPIIAPVADPLETRTINISLINASVNQMLAAVADQAGLNLIVEPAVLALETRADMQLKKISLREAINEVTRAFDLVTVIKGNTLRVALMDERVFALDLLNTTMALDVSSGGNVFGANSSSGSSGSSGGGSNALRGNLTLSGNVGNKTDPYEQIEQSVQNILGSGGGRKSSSSGDKSASKTEGDANKEQTLAITTAHNQAIYTLDRLSGSLYVRARPSQLRSVEKMLERTQKTLRRQVQIEAQLIDVQLNDGFELGVDWNMLRNYAAANFGVSPSQLGPATSILPQGSNGLPSRAFSIPSQLVGSQGGPSFGLAYQAGSFGAVLSALRSFGNVKVLSNPSIMVRNGSPALLSVGVSSRYVSRSSVTNNTPGGGASTTSSDVQTDSVFAGVMVGVVPFVRDDGRIELMVHPMQTDVDARSLQLIDVGNGNRISLPVVSYKGMTTTLNVGNGDTVLIGGLIDQRTSDNDRGAPGVSEIPLFGTLFSNRASVHSSRELVMILKVKVL